MRKGFFLIYFIYIVTISITPSWSQLSCVDGDNNQVDWFIALKFPNSPDFVYLIPTSTQWQPSTLNLLSLNNMIALTIHQSYNNSYFYAYYNDEKPIKSLNISSERGHLKGVLNFGPSSGYWLVHSVPKFPQVKSYKYDEGEVIFAQSFICVTISSANLPQIVAQLLMMQSTVYGYNVPSDFSQVPNLDQFVKNKNVKTPPSNVLPLKTRQLQIFHFGKGRAFANDLYATLVAPSLKTSLYVETWIRGHRVNSSCKGQYQVLNVRKVKLVSKSYRESDDHSKWAVSTSASQPFVCIGDINRMTSQFKRGGGTMCVLNPNIWQIFHVLVSEYEKCA